MGFTIRIAHSEHAFPCEPGESVLEAAGRAGLEIPYSCRKGVCLTCSGKVMAGAVALTEGVRDAARGGFDALLCAARPRSDLVIAPRRVTRATAPGAPREVAATVFRVGPVGPGVVRLHLRFPIGRRMAFRAGQSLEIILPDGARRSYSMANSPGEADGVELHVRVHPRGIFSDQLLGRLRPGDPLRLNLPLGSVQLDGHVARPLLLLATGTGFAPVASILEEAVRRRWTRPLVLYRGGRQAEDLYLPELARRWTRRLCNFSHVPVLSQADAGWEGLRGHVQDAALADFPDLTLVDLYASGSPAMVAEAREKALAHGLALHAFHADAFVAAG
jgi:NAD(P)H-flavin reductase/ferredoxin